MPQKPKRAAEDDRLENALQDRELLDSVPAIAAMQCGVMPISRASNRLVVACSDAMIDDCRAFLQQAFEFDLVFEPYPEGILREYLELAYLQDRNLNHHTFSDAEFLRNTDSWPALLQEKVDIPDQVQNKMPSHEIVFIDISYYSFLRSLDSHAEPSDLQCGDTALPFQIREGIPYVAMDELPDEAIGMVRKDYFHEGVYALHGIEGTAIEYLPHYVHPTELQICCIEADGSVGFYVYDHIDIVAPGQTKAWDVRYYFLSMGARLERRLTLRVNAIVKTRKSAIRHVQGSIEWDVTDVDRWFMLDRQA